MHYTVYEIRHIKSGKVYIGKHQTQNIHDDYFGSGKLLKRAIKKYGPQAFTKTILFDFKTEAEMNAKEAELVTEDFCARKDTYNICEGGKGGFGYLNRNGQNNKNGLQGLALKPNENGKIGASSLWHKLQHNDDAKEDWRIKVSSGVRRRLDMYGSPWLGRQHTPETRLKMSASHKGILAGSKNPMFGKQYITNGVSTKIISKEDAIPEGWRKGRTLSLP